MKIKKAVIPVAGKGTRFLPATKQIPKEMIPIIDKPMIHYAVMEAVESGIEQIIFVTSSGKSSIEDYFDRNMELETFLENNGKGDYKDLIHKIGTMTEVLTVRQKEQLGLGHAILCAKDLIGDENFAVILGDDLVLNGKPVTKQLIECSEKHNNQSVIGVMEVNPQETNKYGIVEGSFVEKDKTLAMTRMIEKPEPKDAPTNLATPGRYILSKNIFSILERIPRGVGGEYQLTDAINVLAQEEKVFAHIFEGDRFDAGSVNGYLEATVEFALRDSKYADVMKKIIKDKVEKYSIR
tara:strand:- start:75821 stop:76705 length:885 start_codon:yes stop_codon:yes gene_type:complete